jgi:general secretion pathway protein J
MRARGARGFTLMEVLLALSGLAMVVVLLVGSLRVGLRAWEASQRQTALQQETRAIVELVSEALEGAYPYRGRLGEAPERVVLFQGAAEEVRFVTAAPPLGLDAPVSPFHAVVLGRTGDRLRVIERLVPADEPFAEAPETVLSRSVTAFRLRYRDEAGLWQDEWDGKAAKGLPTAVTVEVAVSAHGRQLQLPPLVVPLPLGKRTTS